MNCRIYLTLYLLLVFVPLNRNIIGMADLVCFPFAVNLDEKCKPRWGDF